MSKEMIISLVGSAMRKLLVFALAKWGVSGLIDDAQIVSLTNAVLAIGVVVWGCVEKRKALLSDPKAVK